ncbi:aspartic peptidase domain-containing protein [Mycena crocata]|nr:aspartic peptidase domain-containing protein [Mycena crocata]
MSHALGPFLLRVWLILWIASAAPHALLEALHVPLLRSSAPSLVPHTDGSARSSQPRQFSDYTSPFYVAEISIGTPTQTFKMMIDTSISTVMVSRKGCNGCPPGSPYDAATSSTAANKSIETTKIPYGSGSIDGFISADTIDVGTFSVPKAEFLQATDNTDTLPNAISGILGLAFAATGETTATPFWKALMTAGGISTPQMGFWLSRTVETENGSSEEESAGAFTFGGVNSSLYSGDVDFLGLAAGSTALGLWMLDITTINVGGHSVSITPNATLAMFDTKLNAIYGPESEVRAIYAAIPGSSEPVETIFQFPCNTTVNVSVSFGGQTWSIDPRDMNQGPVSGNTSQCYGAIGSMTGDQTPSWKFGIPFMKNVYSVFRESPPSIGFAQLSTLAGGLGTPNASTSATSGGPSSTSSSSSPTIAPVGTRTKSNVGAIAGGVSAGFAVLIIILGFLFCRWRRRGRVNPPGDRTVIAFPGDAEAPPVPVAMAESGKSSRSVSNSSALLSMKRAQSAALENNRVVTNNLLATREGLQLSPGTSSSSMSVLSPMTQTAVSPIPDPAIMQELRTLRDEVRWLVTERTRDDPPPMYT